MTDEDDRLAGPKRSKNAIVELEGFLKDHCKEPQLVDHIKKTFQYRTGHAPNKTMEYIQSIEASTGKIRLFKNSGDLYVQWVSEGSLAEYAEKHPKEPEERLIEQDEEPLEEESLIEADEKAKAEFFARAEAKRLKESTTNYFVQCQNCDQAYEVTGHPEKCEHCGSTNIKWRKSKFQF